MLSSEFLLTSLVVVLIPGTGVIYTVSTGLFLGWRASLFAALGCTLGIVPHLLACILGLSALLHMSAVAFQCLKYAGALYLLYLAWEMWRDKGFIDVNHRGVETAARKVALRGFLINILNPKLSIFFLAFLPLFISPTATSPTKTMFLLSGIFMLMTLIIFILYGRSANMFRKYVIGSPKAVRYLQRSFSATFAALGVKLALTER